MLKVYVGNNINRKAVNVSHDATLRSVLEENNIDYGVGMTSLDGATLQPGDLDKTFAQMNITGDTCYLLNTAKAVNAACGIKVLAQNAVIASGFTREQIEEIAKYRPKALKLIDPETKDELYTCGLTTGDGRINGVGAEYGSGKTSDGKACISIKVPDGEDAKKFIEKTVGVAILNLQKVEDQWEGALREIATEKAAVLDTIEVL
jgi:hypothetical protein